MKTVFHDFQGSLRDSDIHSSLPSRDTSSYSPTVWSQPVLLVPRFTPIQPCRQVTVVTRHNTNVMLGLEWGTTTLFTMEQLREGGRERCMLDMDPWKNLITPPRYDAPAPRLRTRGGGAALSQYMSCTQKVTWFPDAVFWAAKLNAITLAHYCYYYWHYLSASFSKIQAFRSGFGDRDDGRKKKRLNMIKLYLKNQNIHDLATFMIL